MNLQYGNFSLANLNIGSTFAWSNGTTVKNVNERTFLFRFYTENGEFEFKVHLFNKFMYNLNKTL